MSNKKRKAKERGEREKVDKILKDAAKLGLEMDRETALRGLAKVLGIDGYRGEC